MEQKDQLLHITLMDGMVRGLLLTATHTVYPSMQTPGIRSNIQSHPFKPYAGSAYDRHKWTKRANYGSGTHALPVPDGQIRCNLTVY